VASLAAQAALSAHRTDFSAARGPVSKKVSERKRLTIKPATKRHMRREGTAPLNRPNIDIRGPPRTMLWLAHSDSCREAYLATRANVATAQ